jgi:hypothetical protein
MIETAAVIGLDGTVLHWHLPSGRTSGSIPDSRTLWDVLWENRERLAGVAHTHPGGGVPRPSWEDVTTFAAVEAGLGQRLSWWIASASHVVVLRHTGPGRHDYRGPELLDEPPWVAELRRLSGQDAPEDRVARMNTDERITKTVFVVEATDFERHTLWQKWHEKVDWQEVGSGCIREIGQLDSRPVCVGMNWACIHGQLVCFCCPSSEVVDYKMVEKWRDGAFRATWSGGAARCDAWNFHHCLVACKEALDKHGQPA